MLPMSDIKLNDSNPRIIKDRQMKRLIKSIQDFPEMTELRPIVVDENSVILGGNMRYRAMQQLGYKQVEVVKVAGLTDEQKREFIIKDNVPFGDWDWDELANSWDAEKLDNWGLDTPWNTPPQPRMEKRRIRPMGMKSQSSLPRQFRASTTYRMFISLAKSI